MAKITFIVRHEHIAGATKNKPFQQDLIFL